VTATTCLDLRLPAVPASIRKARDAAGAAVSRRREGRPAERDGRLADDVRLCVSEAVTNVVRHAYGRQPGDVELVVERDDGQVSVVVRDDGRGMTKSEREGRAGGYGLKIIERIAARLQIRSRPNAGVEMEMVFHEQETASPRGPSRSGRATADVAY
jgi:anti-sigma regulatory factor (Ser/Thr protein kinase)